MSLKLFETVSSKIKIIKLAKILRINPKFFFDIVIYHFSKLFRGNVDDKIIVLGSANGKAFIGNPKYLYLYLKKNTNYRLYVFAKSSELRKNLKEQGVRTVNNYSLKAIKLLRKARAVFVSHGYEDVLPIKFSPRTVVIQTWHGGDVKIIGNHPYYTKYIYSKWSRLLRAKLRDNEIFNYVVSPSGSEIPLEIASSAFKFPKQRILSVGYPRNDIFFSNDTELTNKLRNNHNIQNNILRIILYAPTYREIFTSKDPFTTEDLIKINSFCKETNSIFLIKAHINEKIINLKDLENIQIVRKDADTQELLCITDILVTDYSSIYQDFLLLNRPILFYTYDYDEYVSKRGIYYKHLEEIAPGPILYTSDELLKALRTANNTSEKYEQKRIELRNYFNKYNDGNSSERLLKCLQLI